MQYRIEVTNRPEFPEAAADEVLAAIRELGIRPEAAHVIDVFILDGDLAEADVCRIADELLHDPVVHQYRLVEKARGNWPFETGPCHSIEVNRKPGVMDPVQASAMKGIADLGIDGVDALRTARRYVLTGKLDSRALRPIAEKVLANKTIEEVHTDTDQVPYPLGRLRSEFEKRTVPIRDLDEEALLRISREGQLSLNATEMRAVQQHFRSLDREPTDLELEILAQTWSEHCVHKTLRGRIEYEGPLPETAVTVAERKNGTWLFDNLLKRTVFEATRTLDKPWCVSVFEDNAGVIEFGEGYDVCFKVETHNHPSAIEPYGGANTGIGGVIRDPLGTGLGAKPILNTDVFCFGPPDMPAEQVPPGALHPRRVMRGVVAGVRDYGNRMGIPTANGAVYFDSRYTGNPLVYCGNVGLIPEGLARKAARPGDLIVVAGGRTGRDGIHGATFSSIELTHESEEISGGAVQIGNAITEKKLVDVTLRARDEALYTCITDCGAGGLSSAVGEMGAELGADAEIERVPLKYQGLSYMEIWISEAQERMVYAVPPENIQRFLDLFSSENVEATVIGRFTGDGVLRVRYAGNLVAELDMHFLHEGLPRFEGRGCWAPPSLPDPLLDGHLTEPPPDASAALLSILGAWNVCSKEWIVRQYDHEVQGGSVLKPLVGAANDGPGDACIAAPLLDSARAVVVSCGLNPCYGDIDPYASAAAAVDEAVRNAVCVGADPDRLALLDNFCWGNTTRPEQLGSLVRAALACHDAALAFSAPFISGKDSLNNEFNTGTETIAIPPTLLVSAISVIPDYTRAVSMDLKAAGSRLYLVGATRPELGGSHYYRLSGTIGRSVPTLDLELAPRLARAVAGAIAGGLVRAAHDCSEGGLAVALAEMAFAGELGAAARLADVPFEGPDAHRRDDVVLFSESLSRYVLEVAPENAPALEAALDGLPFACIGEVTGSDTLEILGLEGTPALQRPLAELKRAWQSPLQL
jgi:phosphoribosylformylglycinamidine synthase